MRARRTGTAVLAAVVVAGALPAAAPADAVTGAELRTLAVRAGDDPGALARLRRVDRVDGRAVDVAGALRGAVGGELQERLRTLETVPAPPPRAAGADARTAARAVLAQRRFTGTRVPGPFRGVLHRLGRALRPLGRAVDWLDRRVPGGSTVVWLALAALVAGAAALLARRTLVRRVRAAEASAVAGRAERDDPAALERRAAEAERAGDHELALRLRFRAGLLRLDARGTIAYRPSLPTGEVARAVRSPDFDALAAAFDDVVYGGRPATGADVDEARERWPRVAAARPAEAVASERAARP